MRLSQGNMMFAFVDVDQSIRFAMLQKKINLTPDMIVNLSCKVSKFKDYIHDKVVTNCFIIKMNYMAV